MYVADSSNCCIQVFTAEGTFLRKFGQHGQGDGQLNFPSSVAIDSENTVYVTEFLASFGTEGNKPGQFKHPYGMTVDNSGMIYVSELRNQRISIFHI